MDEIRYVILGGGVTAGYAARKFVEAGGQSDELCILCAEDRLPYDRPPLSKDILKGERDVEATAINERNFYSDNGIEVLLDCVVTGVDLEERTLTTSTGDTIGFEKLLIATGTKPRRLDIPGSDRDGLLYLRSAADAGRIVTAARRGDKAVVLGGSFIGTEVGASLTERGVDVTLISRSEHLLQGMPLTPKMAGYFERYFERRGVNLVLGDEARSLQDGGSALEVTLASGATHEADFIVAGVGVSPATELFSASELETGDGILVNEYLETRVDGVYAAGDIARYWDSLFETTRRIEHWDNAKSGGEHCALALLGERRPYLRVPYFFSDVFDLSWEFWGDHSTADQVVYRGAVEDGSFSVWWLNGSTVVGAFVMNRPNDERELAQELIRSGRTVSAEDLEAASALPTE